VPSPALVSKREAWISLRIGATAYVLLLALQLLGAVLSLRPLGRLVRGLLAPGFVSASALFRLATGLPPGPSSAWLVLPASVLDIALLSGAVLLIRRGALGGGRALPPGPPAPPVGPARARSLIESVKLSLKIGFGIAVLLTAFGLLLPSPRLFPFEAPGAWICARLFGQPEFGPPEVLIILFFALNTVVFSAPVLFALLILAARRTPRP